MLSDLRPLDVRDIPGLERLEYLKPPGPAFLDRGGQPRVCGTAAYSADEWAASLIGLDEGKEAYIYAAWTDITKPDSYILRYAIGDRWISSQLVSDLQVGELKINRYSLMPERSISLTISAVDILLADIAAAWGEAEAATQFGMQLLRQLKQTTAETARP